MKAAHISSQERFFLSSSDVNQCKACPTRVCENIWAMASFSTPHMVNAPMYPVRCAFGSPVPSNLAKSIGLNFSGSLALGNKQSLLMSKPVEAIFSFLATDYSSWLILARTAAISGFGCVSASWVNCTTSESELGFECGFGIVNRFGYGPGFGFGLGFELGCELEFGLGRRRATPVIIIM